ncbi:MAG: SUMF1/EgtB/PvdO family nonheme iron enzyme [Chitinispirillaceae bacterium]|nr:SUMF1/EgtB/PvdO family nonheme iron enzyme [Chitinispirillaceae bacterium]
MILTLAHDVHSAPEPNLRGRVMDWNSNGVPDAIVRLNLANLQVKTDRSGYFSFNSAHSAHKKTPNKIIMPDIQLRNTVLNINRTATGVPVVVSLFTTSGKKIAVVYSSKSATENVAVDISRWIRTAQMVIIQVATGSEKYTIPVISFTSSHCALSSPCHSADLSSHLQKKNATANDVITITHFGYNSVTYVLSTLDTMIDSIKLSYEFRNAGDPAGMIRIPGGVFQMGANTPGTASYPAHSVFVSPFFMDSTEVTQSEYVKLTGKEPWLKHEKAAACGVGPLYPAWYVNWNDAVQFCNQRSKKVGLDTVYTWTGVDGEPGDNGILLNVKEHFEKNGYRLPTEAEWEYACRAGTRTGYYWGATADSAISTRHEWSFYNSKPASKTNEVARLIPNPLRLYDMGGNQFEWCNDRYAEYTNDFQENPGHASENSGPVMRVNRSGHHGESADNFTSSARYISDPVIKNDADAAYGIRTVRSVVDKQQAATKSVNGVFQLFIDQVMNKTVFVGRLYNGPMPVVDWDTVMTIGECRLIVRKMWSCPGCGNYSLCVNNNKCIPEPDTITAGTVTVSGYTNRAGTTTSTVTPIYPSSVYQPTLDNRPANPPCTEGEIITLTASGNDYVAGFSISARSISKIEIAADTIPMNPGEDINLKWKAAANPADSRIHVIVDISYHGGTKAKIDCDCLDDGELTIPAAMLDSIKTYGMSGYPKIEMFRISVGTNPDKKVLLMVQSYVLLWLKIPGLISCLPGGDGNCPSGMTCRDDQRCVPETDE